MSARHDDPGIEGIGAAWTQLWNRTQIGVIETKREYRKMIKLMDSLVDEIGDHDGHPLSGLLRIVSALIQEYERKNVQLPATSAREKLRFLMKQHGLRQADLSDELGSQGIVSEILNGKRNINLRQAKALAVRFGLSPEAFL